MTMKDGLQTTRSNALIASACLMLFPGFSVYAQQVDETEVYSGNTATSVRTSRADVTPYLEVQQILVADLKSGGEVLTYSSVAAGVDASIQTRRAEAQVSLRYERRIAWDDDIGDQDVISGLARGSIQLVPNAVSLEAGALATRSRVDLGGPASANLVGGIGNVSQVYSAYAGPTVSTNVGSVSVNAAYRFGYTRADSPDAVIVAPGQTPIDIFDDSVSHSISASIGQQPGNLPVGWAIGGGYNREDTSQLDQRFEDAYVRADLTVPISPTIAIVGGVGYEDVQISERDAVRDANGAAVRGPDGRFVTNESSPRLLSYDQNGFIWDAGVLWRPSRRTSLEARIGRRYGSTSYTGSFSFQPNRTNSFNIFAYDTVAGFGSRLNDSLASLPTQFDTSRNPLSGDLNGCVFGGAQGLCFNDVLQSVASSTFRTRGIGGQYTTQAGGWNAGIAAGYNRRRFFASDAGALALANGIIDENYYANVFISRKLDQRSSISSNFYANYFDSGLGGEGLGFGTNAAYYRNIFDGLSASAALGLDSFDREGFDSELIGSAQVGLRYSF